MSGSPWTLPNVITVARIVACPVIFFLAIAVGIGPRFAAFGLFVAAGLSDVWDGYLARKHGLVTDVGKLLDPLADKLLLAATLIPFYLVSHRPEGADVLPFWGPFPMWVLLVIFGREILITVFRSYAAGKGVIIAAGGAGKQKTLLQALFIGGLLLWWPLEDLAVVEGWVGTEGWAAWSMIHGVWIAVTLAGAVVLTIYSMLDYLWRYRSLLGIRS